LHPLNFLLQHKRKFILVHSSNGHKYALEKVMRDLAIQTHLADARTAAKMRALECFYEMLGKDDDCAFYDWSYA
jgi:protein pelota